MLERKEVRLFVPQREYRGTIIMKMSVRQIAALDKNLIGKAVHGQNRILEREEFFLISVGVYKHAVSLQEYYRKN